LAGAAAVVGTLGGGLAIGDRLLSRPPQLRERVRFGSYVEGLPHSDQGLLQFEETVGRKMDIISWFADWSSVPGADEHRLAATGRPLLVAWEPSEISGDSVLRGAHDDYLIEYARAARSLPTKLYLRMWPEMNASWSEWQPTDRRPTLMDSEQQFIGSWRHVVDVFRSEGAENVKFVFNPDASDGAANSNVPGIWPGEDFVDVLGIDGYNWGGDEWRDFSTIFEHMYSQLASLHSTAPVWICEMGCSEGAAESDKVAWLEDMLTTRSFGRLDSIVFFNTKKERDWRLESSPGALKAAQRLLG